MIRKGLEPLDGVTVVPVTPMTRDGAVDPLRLGALTDRMIDGGIGSLMAAGHTGEFYSLTFDEWHAVVGTVVEASRGRAATIGAVGHGVGTAVAMAAVVGDLGCPAVLVHQPPHPLFPADGYRDYLRAIAEVGLPLIPYVSRRDLLPAIHDCARDGIVAAVKWGIADSDGFAEARQATPDVAWLCGLGERAAPEFTDLGAVGYTSGLGNVHPLLAVGFHQALRDGAAGPLAALRPGVERFERLRSIDHGSISVIKEALALLGWCERTVRPPLHTVSPDVSAAIGALLDEWALAPAGTGAPA